MGGRLAGEVPSERADHGRVCRRARKLRLESPGAIDHVINRGNHRAWVFGQERTKAAFAACVLDACVRDEWIPSTDGSNAWLVTEFAMGSPRHGSKHVGRLPYHPSGKAPRWLARLKRGAG